MKNLFYSIYDVNGKKMDEGKVKNRNQIVDISSFNSGLYVIKINDKKGNIITSNKVIKK